MSASKTPEQASKPAGGAVRGLRPIYLAWTAFGMILIGALVLSYDYFKPRPVLDIQVQGNRNLAAAEVMRLSRLKTGQVWERAELNQVEADLELHPFIKSGQVSRERLPDGERLVVTIVERQCVALVQNDREPGILYEIDAELSILSENRPRCKNVPLLRGQFQKETDQFADPMLAQMLRNWLQMQKLFPELSGYVSEIRVRREGGLVLYLTGRQVRFIIPHRLNQALIRKIYSSISYIYQSDMRAGRAELRGEDVLLFPEGAR